MRQPNAVITVEPSVATLAAGYRSIPMRKVKTIVSHSFSLKKTLTAKNSEQKAPIRNIFARMQKINPATSASKDVPARIPATIVPRRYVRIIPTPPKIPIVVFEMT